MITQLKQIKISTYIIAIVWLVNGLFCKILNLVPRHKQIIAAILGDQVAPVAVIVIGVLEILMSFWILSRIKSDFCVVTQIVIIMTMNVIEFIMVPELLLFGKVNIVFAFLFCLFIFYFEFFKKQKAA